MCLVAAAILALTAPASAFCEALTDVLKWNRADVAVRTAGEYYSITVQGGRIHGAPGEPALPSCAVHYRVPADRKVESFRILDERWASIGSGYLPIPVQEPVRIGHTPDFHPADGEGYAGTSWYPPEAFEYTGGGYLRGRRIESFLARPVRYSGLTGELQYLEKLVVEIELVDGEGPPIEVRRAVVGVEEEFDRLVRGLVRRDVGPSHREWMEQQAVLLGDGKGKESGFIP